MRHLLKYESSKLWHNKLFCLALIFLLVLGGSLQIQQLPPQEKAANAASLRLLLQTYADDPQGTETQIRQEMEEIDRLSLIVEQLYDQRRDEEAAALAATIPLENYAAKRELLSLIEQATTYPDRLRRVISDAQKKQYQLLASGTPSNSFAVRYQEGIILHYTAQLEWDLFLPVDQVQGWDRALQDTPDAIVLLLAWLIGGILLLLPEKSGMLPLIRSTKHGRLPTAMAKLLCGAIMSATVTLLFSGLQLLLLATRMGLHGGNLPLQSVLPLSPFPLSIWGGFVIKLLLRALIGTVFVWGILLLSLFCCRYVSVLGLGGGLIGVSYYLHNWGAFRPHHPLKMFNLLDMITAQDYLCSWNTFRLGSQCVDYTVSLPLVLLGTALLLAALNMICYTQGRLAAVQLKPMKKLCRSQAHHKPSVRSLGFEKMRTRFKRSAHAPFPNSLISWEWRKLSRHLLTPILLCLLIVGEIWLIGTRYAPNTTWRDSVYEQYMSTLEGDWSEEKSEWLKSEQRRLHELESQKSDIYAQYLAGELSLEEYRNRIGAATDAELVLEVFDVVLEQDAYLRQQAQQGESAVYLYDTGWRLLLNEREDYVLTAIIILLFAGLYADEHSLCTVPLLRATKKGRRQLFLSKLGMVSMLSGGVQLLLLLVRVNVLRTNYHLPQPHATASSMAEFGATNSSILGMVVSVMLLRWFSILLLTLLTVSISACFRNTIAATLFTGISIYLSPLLSLLGVSTFETFTLNNTLAATPLLLDGTSRTAAIVMLGVTLALTLLAAWRERCFET